MTAINKKPLLERLRIWIEPDKEASTSLNKALDKNKQAHDTLDAELEKLTNTLDQKRQHA